MAQEVLVVAVQVLVVAVLGGLEAQMVKVVLIPATLQVALMGAAGEGLEQIIRLEVSAAMEQSELFGQARHVASRQLVQEMYNEY